MFSPRIAAPAACPSCAGTVWVPMLKAYRYAGSAREHAGDVADCAACGCRCTLLRDGRVLRLGGARAGSGPAQAGSAAAVPTGGYGTGGPGWLDPDMVTLDTHAGP